MSNCDYSRNNATFVTGGYYAFFCYKLLILFSAYLQSKFSTQ